MNHGEMVMVPRALLGAVAHALETGNTAPKTLAAVRDLYLSNDAEADDFPDTTELQEAGKHTDSADWSLEVNS